MKATLGLRQAYISQQLMVLRQVGLVTDWREGWNVFYRVVKPEVSGLVDAVLATVQPAGAALLPFRHAKREAYPCPKCQLELVL
jgi:hypothetical protein